MKRLFTIFWALLLSTASLFAGEEDITLNTPTGDIHGKLMSPDCDAPCPVVIIIAGSGPTDMNGNTIGAGITNNSLLYLAQELVNNGIATVRYDKRGIGKSTAAGTKEEDLRFDHYIEDATMWADKLAGDSRFSKVIIAGHSEGSLIGMVAAKRSKAVKGYISISGCGCPAYEILEKQMQAQPAQIQEESAAICKELREGRTVEQVPFYLAALYRQSVQPYLISWFAYNPAVEIAKLDIPVLILQGDKDIQVGVEEAEKLHAAHQASSMYVVKDMNHVLKQCGTNDRMAQLATYSDPKLPIKPELISHIVEFIRQ
ncbi:MAG: alpha/beta hydrolase [Bacteroidaceae bacterium]|nr:alpha/beta hydrolase [Bacteroidaceae bacterium]